MRTAEADEQRRRNLARKELAWLRRGPQARSTKPKFRVDAANALIAAEPPAREAAELTRMATARLGKTVLELENVSLSVAGSVILKGSVSGEQLRTPLMGVGIGQNGVPVQVGLNTGEALQLDASASGNVSGYITYDLRQTF